ncbi:MAG: adenylate/guanylate cyclase domain-containing protein [Verrucomicrobiota bacterium]|jgi:class 3 adenylate cyclase/tetratricopeptide (TPR) repeat protein
MTGRRSANQHSPRQPAGERKQITILFGDFAGFTAFSERLDPEDLRNTMVTIWSNLDAIILAHGGTPEKHIGDAIMAVFGLRQSREEDPAEAVRAALAMQAWLTSGNSDHSSSGLRMRIGINTGLVVIGPGDHGGELLATGDAVNLASRLQESAPAGGVLISRETYRLVFGFFDVQRMPLQTVKGKSEPVETYLILRAKARGVALQMRGIQGVGTEMIGRQQQLERLQNDFRRVLHRRAPQITIVVGEAGIGKSRLLSEFHKKTELFPEFFRLFIGRASTEIATQPFALIRDLFCARFEIQESDPAALARDKFERGLTGLLERGTETQTGTRETWLQDIHFMGQILGLEFSASPQLRDVLDAAEQIRQRAFHGFGRLFEAMSQCPATEHDPECRGVLVVVEDLHWCDDASLELIEHLIRNCEAVPLMILCSARPSFFERHPGWCGDLPNAIRLNLDGLSVSESNALVESVLRNAGEIPARLRELATEGTDGNPFYIEETIKMLMDQRVILPQAGQWEIEIGRLDRTRIPSTLTGVLQARLDGLSPAERWVLQCASVAGRVFWDGAVEQMGAGDRRNQVGSPALEGAISRNEILSALDDLQRKELVFGRASSAFADAAEFTFKHELLRNVAYESLLKKSRRHYHACFAEWLKDHCGDRIREFAPVIANHFEQASQLAEAAEWHGHAGQQARLGYSPATAIAHFKKALQLLPKEGMQESALLKQQLEWQAGLVETLVAQARFAEAQETSQVVCELAKRLSDPAVEAHAWNDMAFLHERRGDNRASIKCAEQAEGLALEAAASGRAERIRALLIKGWAFYRLGNVSAVLELGSKVLEASTELGDRRATAISYKLLGVAHLQLGHFLKADRFFEQGRALFVELGDQRNAAAMWSNRGESARAGGDHQAAAGFYEQALAIARQIGSRESELIYLNNLSAARLGLQLFEQAETELRQVISQTSAPNSCSLAETWTFLSQACLGQGKLAEAIDAGQKAIHLAQESENPLYLGEAWRALGRIEAASSKLRSQPTGAGADQDRTMDAGHCFAESLQIFRRINAAGEQARTLRDLAEYELQQGEVEPARQRLLEARNIFQELGAPLEVAATERLLRRHGSGDEPPGAG